MQQGALVLESQGICLLLKDLLGLVTELERVRRVVIRGTHEHSLLGANDGLDFDRVSEGRVEQRRGLQVAGLVAEHADAVLCAEAVSRRSRELGLVLGGDGGADGLDDGVDVGNGVVREPCVKEVHEVEAGAGVELVFVNGVAGKEIGHDDVEALGGVVVGEKLVVEELIAEDVGEEVEYAVLGVGLVADNVGLDWRRRLEKYGYQSGGWTRYVPPLMVTILPVGSPARLLLDKCL